MSWSDETLELVKNIRSKIKVAPNIWRAMEVLTEILGAECGTHLRNLVFQETDKYEQEIRRESKRDYNELMDMYPD